MGRLHLVRHGEVDNPSGVIYGRLPGFGLSARGREQVARAGEHLASRLGSAPRLVASPLQRTQQSARILMEHLGVGELELDERLIEADSGFEGFPRGLRIQRMARALLDPTRRRRAERPSRVLARMAEAVREWRSKTSGELVIVSHQFPILMARVALERGVHVGGGPRLVRGLPWAFVRGGCALASVSTMELGSRAANRTYWAPE
ncbi:MAG: histidine phosphatase family protein [Sandaracinaceae bacterium]